MSVLMEESRALESTTVGIYRTATVVKGGRRFSFSAMVVMGDRHGSVGLGYGKGRGVPAAIEKAEKASRKSLVRYTLKEGTLPHPVIGRYGSSIVKLIPASPGTGVIAGGTVRAVLEMVGVHDCLTKSYGSTNQKNLCKATIDGLSQLRSREEIAALRGVEIDGSVVEEKLAAGRRYEPKTTGGESKAKGPVNTVRKQRSGGRSRGGRGQGGGGEVLAADDRGARSSQASSTGSNDRAQPVDGGEADAGGLPTEG